jgi:hypothetical protein
MALLFNVNTALAQTTKGTPAKITDSYGIWTDFDLRSKPDADKFRSQVGSALFEEIANNCNEKKGWPGAISSYEERNKVRDQMLKYVCYQIGEVDDKWVLRVPADENKFLPYGVRPEHDIYFMVRKTDVQLTGSPTRPASAAITPDTPKTQSSSTTTGSVTKGPRAKVKDSFGIWTDFDLRSKSDAAQVKAKLGYAVFEDVANYCSEKSWPAGISSFTEREKVRSEMKQYVCYQIAESDDKWILLVPASENTFQPYGIRPTRDVYFVVRKSDVDLSGTPINTLSGSSTSTYTSSTNTSSSFTYTGPKGVPAKINRTGGLYSTVNMGNESSAYSLKQQLGNTLFDDIAIYCREEKWPEGISTLSARDRVRSEMNNYKAYKIAEYDKTYILRIPAGENNFMPYNMRLSRDFYFVINKDDVTLSQSSSGSSPNSTSAYTSTGTPAKINATGGMYSDYNLNTSAGALRSKLGDALFDEVATYCIDDNWPEGIKTFSNREKVRTRMNDYKAYMIAEYDGKYILRIPANENGFMPYDMRPARDIYFVINKTDVTLGSSSSGSSSAQYGTSNTFSDSRPATVNYNTIVGFGAQLNALMEAYPGNFENIKGDKLPEDTKDAFKTQEWYSKVKLEGSEKTIVRKEWLGSTCSVQAYYNEYKSKDDAMNKYRELIKKVQDAALPCCTMVQNDEYTSSEITSTAWLPFDLSGKMGPGYDKIILEVRVIKLLDIDKETFKTSDKWFVSLSVYKQK